MSFSTYFSEQAKQPTGLFGRIVMATIFNKGNAYLNGFVNELMAVTDEDYVLEIGFGSGALIHKMAKQINDGQIEGVDIYSSMVSIARKRNKKYIFEGKVKIIKGNCWDNAPVESFFSRFKVECIYPSRYTSIDQARADIFEYIEIFYNRKRRHSAVGNISPMQFEQLYYN